jgi:hypothetical protein
METNYAGDSSSMSDNELAGIINQLSRTSTSADDKHNQFTFLNNVVMTEDTTRVGFVTEEELGSPQLPVRANKTLALISGELMENNFFKEYFLKESENITSTSLSKNGFLINRAILQKREIADVTKPRKVNKSWFKKKEDKEEGAEA